MTLAEVDVEDAGPVDELVIEFPADRQSFTGEMLDELRRLVASGTIRVLDVVAVTKGPDGELATVAVEELGEGGGPVADLVALGAAVAETLASDDLARVAEAMTPGSVAAVVIFENRWAAPFAAAARRAGGRLVASERVPIQSILGSIDAETGES